MDHKAVIFVMLLMCLATMTASVATPATISPYTRRELVGLYSDRLYDHMAGGFTSAQLHSDSHDFVFNGRDMLEDADPVPSYMDDYNKKDVEALLAFKDAIKDDPFESLSSWTAEKGEKVCSWTGIACSAQDSENGCPSNGRPCRQPTQRVVSIILPGLGLEGSLPASLGKVPSSMGSLSSLRLLNLSGNRLEGTIPASLSWISTLEQLDLAKNNISGKIPQDLAKLSMLASLDLSSNILCGPIPKGVQLSTFSVSSFEKNKCLCGNPLNPCNGRGSNTSSSNASKNNNVKMKCLSGVNDLNIWLITLGIGMGIRFGL